MENYFSAHRSRRLIGELIVYGGIRCPFHNSHIASIGRGCFCSNRIRTLVAMATYYSHRLIMGKVDLQFFCLNGDIWIFLQKCLLSNPLHFIRFLSKSVNLIGCQGHKKGLLLQKR